MGHILDRKTNKKSSKHLKPMWDRISSITEADMRDLPALQMADLFAWCISHRLQKPRHKWQNRILNHRKWLDDWLEYDQLMRVIPGISDLVKSWNLTPRRATR